MGRLNGRGRVRAYHEGYELCKYCPNTFSGMKPSLLILQFLVTPLPKACLTVLQSDQFQFFSVSSVFLITHIYSSKFLVIIILFYYLPVFCRLATLLVA